MRDTQRHFVRRTYQPCKQIAAMADNCVRRKPARRARDSQSTAGELHVRYHPAKLYGLRSRFVWP